MKNKLSENCGRHKRDRIDQRSPHFAFTDGISKGYIHRECSPSMMRGGGKLSRRTGGSGELMAEMFKEREQSPCCDDPLGVEAAGEE